MLEIVLIFILSFILSALTTLFFICLLGVFLNL